MNKKLMIFFTSYALLNTSMCIQAGFFKKVWRHPKKAFTSVVRTVENKVLEPLAHAAENELIEPAANGANDHIFKPFARAFKKEAEKKAEEDGQAAADIAHQLIVGILTGQLPEGQDTEEQEDGSEKDSPKRTAAQD
ncbi:MAG TPA: hypothetical protein PKD74_04910, partial [Candidatus Dependentiae bacterium]|nr:hypothetical protein [Candidatus Dependentiae bacterium]